MSDREKRLIRERMARTNESYSIARMNVRGKPQAQTPALTETHNDEPDDDRVFDEDFAAEAAREEARERDNYPTNLFEGEPNVDDPDPDDGGPDEPDDEDADDENPAGSPRFQAFINSLRVSYSEMKDGGDNGDRIVDAARRLRVYEQCYCGEPEVDAYSFAEAAEQHPDMNGETPSQRQRDELIRLLWSSIGEECGRHSGGPDDDDD